MAAVELTPVPLAPQAVLVEAADDHSSAGSGARTSSATVVLGSVVNSQTVTAKVTSKLALGNGRR